MRETQLGDYVDAVAVDAPVAKSFIERVLRDTAALDCHEKGQPARLVRLAEVYERAETCPDELLLFFHHVRYDHVLHSGRSVVQHV